MGAYGGRAELMDMIAPLGPVYQAGTLSGNPLAMAAGIATLRELKTRPGIYQQLDQRSAALVDARFADAAHRWGGPVRQVRAAGKPVLPALSQQHRQDRVLVSGPGVLGQRVIGWSAEIG